MDLDIPRDSFHAGAYYVGMYLTLYDFVCTLAYYKVLCTLHIFGDGQVMRLPMIARGTLAPVAPIPVSWWCPGLLTYACRIHRCARRSMYIVGLIKSKMQHARRRSLDCCMFRSVSDPSSALCRPKPGLSATFASAAPRHRLD